MIVAASAIVSYEFTTQKVTYLQKDETTYQPMDGPIDRPAMARHPLLELFYPQKVAWQKKILQTTASYN